jgi:hypothetical protein
MNLVPTARRLAFRDALAAGKVYGYDWAPMQAYLRRNELAEETVTGQAREFMRHGLAKWRHGGTGEREQIVLTPEGEAWPGSTSPEPGPRPVDIDENNRQIDEELRGLAGCTCNGQWTCCACQQCSGCSECEPGPDREVAP